jgi:hypothetical protein
MSTNRLTTGNPKRDAKVRRAGVAASTPVISWNISPVTCPLSPSWPARLRQIRFGFSSPAEEAQLKAAHYTDLRARSTIIDVEWHAAGDDHSQETPAPDAHLFAGFPYHIHSEFEVGGQRVHIDRTWANLWGPGRLKEEWHIFIDGGLAGFGGQMGCSLGFYMAIMPAVALLRDERAIVVHRKLGRRGIELQKVLLEPDQIALYALGKARL